jgi:hypothetical protein
MSTDKVSTPEEIEAAYLIESIAEAKRLSDILAQLNEALDVAIEARDANHA